MRNINVPWNFCRVFPPVLVFAWLASMVPMQGPADVVVKDRSFAQRDAATNQLRMIRLLEPGPTGPPVTRATRLGHDQRPAQLNADGTLDLAMIDLPKPSSNRVPEPGWLSIPLYLFVMWLYVRRVGSTRTCPVRCA